jgi:ferredoxin-NADP reductase/predicted pyridoxine 5'-phosphate oxidase superfamily flavin-nucleotide-binding protein
MAIDQPYHEGELAVQQRVNEAGMAQMNGTAIDASILAGALGFIEQQAMVVIGSVDAEGQVWSSVLFGQPGFVRALNDRTLELNVSQATAAGDDPLWENLLQNSNVGLLLIELGSRRRLRINGKARAVAAHRWIIDVERAYPNCPKYIQRRMLNIQADAKPLATPAATRGTALNGAQQSLIAAADTLFVASAHLEHGVDASHRGGHPGFVTIINDRQLRIPDFAGNSMFNTLGNFVSYPHAGLVFIDFERNRLLQLTGVPEILWERDDPRGETGGTRRFWQFEISTWQELPLPVDLSWEFVDTSPHIPPLHMDAGNNSALSLQVAGIGEENARVKSFRLRAADGRMLPGFEAGAHIQVKVTLPDGTASQRHYSLLSDPDDRSCYEIGVLKENSGRGGSRYMHEHVHVGDVLEIRAPKNEFALAAQAEHSILIAGGIGITPMLAMMHTLATARQSFELHYSARTQAELVFRNRIETISGGRARFYASQQADGLGENRHIDLQQLLATPKPGVHVYICGPRRLIMAVRDIATDNGWPASQIHFESFGARPLPGDRPIQVHLNRSNRTVTVPAVHSILDTLLAAGVNVPHDCKRGECSLCATRVLEGKPEHRDLCLSKEEQATSMCVCVSRARGETLLFDL